MDACFWPLKAGQDAARENTEKHRQGIEMQMDQHTYEFVLEGLNSGVCDITDVYRAAACYLREALLPDDPEAHEGGFGTVWPRQWAGLWMPSSEEVGNLIQAQAFIQAAQDYLEPPEEPPVGHGYTLQDLLESLVLGGIHVALGPSVDRLCGALQLEGANENRGSGAKSTLSDDLSPRTVATAALRLLPDAIDSARRRAQQLIHLERALRISEEVMLQDKELDEE